MHPATLPMTIHATARTEELACARALAAARSAGIHRPRVLRARVHADQLGAWTLTVTSR